jgi:Protein of unknown function (DUF1682)
VPPVSDASATLPLVTAVFAFIDVLPKISLRPETKAKIKRVREELDKELKKELEKDKEEVRPSCFFFPRISESDHWAGCVARPGPR